MFTRKLNYALILLAIYSHYATAATIGHFLLGVEGGIASRDGDLNYELAHPAPGSAITSRINTHNDNGFIWGVLAGYQMMCNEYLLGAELNLSWQDFGEDKNFGFTDVLGGTYAASAKHARDTVIGLTARAGYALAPWMLAYVRAGVETSKEEIHFDATRTPGPLIIAIDEGRQSARFTGGFGFEFPFMYRSSLRIEYYFSSRGKGAGASKLASDNLTLASANIKPIQHAIKAAFIWNLF